MDVVRATLDHAGCPYREEGRDAVRSIVETRVADYVMMIVLGDEGSIACICAPFIPLPVQNVVRIGALLKRANDDVVPLVRNIVFQLDDVAGRIACCAVFVPGQLTEAMMQCVIGATLDLSDQIQIALSARRKSA
jgi:hypothetical protein